MTTPLTSAPTCVPDAAKDSDATPEEDLEASGQKTRSPIFSPEKGYGAASVASQKLVTDDEALFGLAIDGRHPCLDVTRSVCIWLACVDHQGTTFGVWNVMYVQAWVLQYLFLICGVCFGMSSKSLSSFLARLGAYFCVGVACNCSAWAMLGKDWKNNMWDVVFQFWFVLGLMMFVSLLAPLRSHLRHVREAVQSCNDRTETTVGRTVGLAKLLAGYTVIAVIYFYILIPMLQRLFARPLATLVTTRLGEAAEFWGLPADPDAASDFLKELFGYFQLSISNVYLAFVFPMVSSNLGMCGWLMLLNMYSHKCFLYRAEYARMINGFDFTLLGMVCYFYGLSCRKTIGTYLLRYWFVVLFVCALLWPPGTVGRFDEDPPTELAPRAKDNLLEMVFAILFLTALERMIDHKIFTQDRLDFMSNWTLLLYLVHVAIYLLAPSPWNWFFMLALMFPAYLFTRMSSTRANTSEGNPQPAPNCQRD